MQKYEREELISPMSERITNRGIEIEGISVKCISSNIRRPNIQWDALRLVSGIGREGSLVLVQAMSNSGSTTHVENQQGRDEKIYQGDNFIGVLANRHSGTSESGDVPSGGIEITSNTEVHLLSTGGVIGINTGIPPRMRQEPFRLRSIGLLASSDGEPLDLAKLCGPYHETVEQSAPIIMVCGTSAEVGKTTTSASLIKAFSGEGMRVGGTKFSGTGRMRDIMSLRDAGAMPWIDFPDVGLATTYTTPKRFTPAIYTLFNYVNAGHPDIIIAEAGGDPIEANVPTFLENRTIMQYVKACVIVAGDVMGMMGTVAYLRQYAPDMPLFVTDPKDRNPVSTRERVRHELGNIPIFNSLNSSEVSGISQQIKALL